MDGENFTVIQEDLIQMDDYPVDSCAISPTAFLLNVPELLGEFSNHFARQPLIGTTSPPLTPMLNTS